MNAQFSLVVNGKPYTVDTPVVTGFDIRALAGAPLDLDLIVEGSGNEPDRVLRDDQQIHLTLDAPLHVYIRPPTMFGEH